MLEGIKNFFKEIKEQAEEQERQKEEQKRAEEQKLIDISNGNVPILDVSGIILKKGEYCHFKCDVERVISSTRKSYKTQSAGVSLRVADGLTLRSGGGNITPVEIKDYKRYNGRLFITNKRIIFLNPEKPCNVLLTQITGLDQYTNAFGMYKDSTYYLFMTNEINMIRSVVDGIFKKYKLN